MHFPKDRFPPSFPSFLLSSRTQTVAFRYAFSLRVARSSTTLQRALDCRFFFPSSISACLSSGCSSVEAASATDVMPVWTIVVVVLTVTACDGKLRKYEQQKRTE